MLRARKSRSVLFAALGFLTLFSVWYFLSEPWPSVQNKPHSIIDPFFLPSIHSVIRAFASSTLFEHLGVSIFRTFGGVVIASLLALLLSTFVVASVLLEGLVKPLTSIRYIPISAFVPLSILWFGLGETQKILIIGIGTFLQAIPLYVSSLRGVEQNLIDIGRVYGLSKTAIITKIRLRRALPGIYDATRVIFGIGWSCLLTAEIVGSTRGLGFYIAQSQRYVRIDAVFAAMSCVGLVGLIVDSALLRLRRQLFRWDWRMFSQAEGR